MSGPAAAMPQVATLRRRLYSLLYEVLVLFGVALLAGAVGALLLKVTGQQQSGVLQVIAFLIFSGYFVWFWTRHGQTLPMQTWQIRLVSADGGPVTARRAWLRCVLALGWFAPGAAVAHLLGWPPKTVLAAAGVNVAAYAALALALPKRQFLHDVLAGTRIVDAPREVRAAAA